MLCTSVLGKERNRWNEKGGEGERDTREGMNDRRTAYDN